MVDVIPRPDGSCATIVVAGNGYQAGVGALFQFEAVFTSTVTVAAAGDATFGLLADDGWILALGPDAAGRQPSYVAGSRYNAPATGPFTSYPVVGAYNDHEDVTRHTLTVHFPAAGTYPVELDYTERNGGNLALTFEVTVPPEVQATAVAQAQATATMAALAHATATVAARATATTEARATATTEARATATAAARGEATATAQAQAVATAAQATAATEARGEVTAQAMVTADRATAATEAHRQTPAAARAQATVTVPAAQAATATAVARTLRTARPSPTSSARSQGRLPFALHLAGAPASVVNGGTVFVHVQTAPDARLQGAYLVTTRRSVLVGTGARRRRVTRVVTLYALPLHGQVGARGVLTLPLRIAYQPARPSLGHLTLTARVGRRVVSAVTALTIRPLPLSVGVSPRSVRAGTRLTVVVQTVPRTALRVVVQVTPPRHGRSPYGVTVTGVADRRGRFTRTVHLAYRPARPLPLQFVVTARSGAATVISATRGTLRP